MLRKRHGTAVEPAVDHFRHTVHFLAAVRAFDRYFINIRTMQFNIVRTVVRFFFQLFDAADAVLMAAFTLPHRKRSTPVTVSGKSPVLNVLQPIAETSFSDALRDPVDGVVVGDQVIPYRCHLDEPGLTRIVDQRCVASPAVRVAVLEFRCIIEKPSRIQIL